MLNCLAYFLAINNFIIMDYYTSKISYFIMPGANKGRSFLKIFATKPTLEKEKNLGKLFGIIEIREKNDAAAKFVDYAIGQLKKNYYINYPDEADLSLTFEQALKKTNNDILVYLETEKKKINLKNLNLIFILIKNHEIYITNLGSLTGYLIFYKQRADYRILNILEAAGAEAEREEDRDKIFLNITAGKIGALDYLFLGTPNIFYYLSLEKIKNLITQNPQDELPKKFKEILEEKKDKEIMAAVIISLDVLIEGGTRVLEKFNFEKAAADDSMKELMATEMSTQKFLSPSIIGGFLKYGDRFKNIFSNYVDRISNFKINRPAIPKKLNAFRGGATTVRAFFNASFHFLKNIFKRSSTEKNAPGSSIFKTALNFAVARFKRMPKISKLFLIVFIFLIIMLGQNIVSAVIKNRRQNETDRVNEIITEAAQKRDGAQASLIYQDEKNARVLLAQAKELIDTVPKKFENSENVINLKNDIEMQIIELRHEVNIEEPILIGNFRNLDSNILTAPVLLKLGQNIYTQNQKNQSILRLNLDSRQITAASALEQQVGKFTAGVEFNADKLLFLNENQEIFSYNPEGQKIKIQSIEIEPASKVVAMAIYNNRLYLADINKNQILRYRIINDVFDQPRELIEDQTVDLHQAADIAIDGNIYVLTKNGEILKLENGVKVPFDGIIFDPPLSGPSKIKTEFDSSYIYILDPPTKRLVVINKEGQLIAQYRSDAFDNMKDFIVAANEAKIYILNGSMIYGIPAEHLE